MSEAESQTDMEYPSFILVNSNRRFTANRPLIGITGKAGSGKDTLGTAVQGDFGNQIQKMSFAEPLKRAIAAMLDVDYTLVEGLTEQSRDWREQDITDHLQITPRSLMLSMGTEWGRDLVDEDIWVHLAERAYDRLQGGAFFTDVRFDNEAHFIQHRGGIVVEVRCTDSEVQSDPTHRSEHGINPQYVDAVVKAPKGDIVGLQKMGLRAIRELGCQPSY